MALLRPGTTEIRLPEIGRIFKGGPKRENPNKPSGALIMGLDLDHFRFEPALSTQNLPSPDNNGTLAEYLVRQYAELGDSPRALPIQFLHAEIEKDFSAINEVWAKVSGVERCVRRCDGQSQKLHLVNSGEKKMLLNQPIPCAAIEGMNKCPMDCKPTGRLSFVMPCLNYPGLVIMTTHSIYDIVEIQGNLAMYSNWDINKIPFQLCRTEKTINRTNDDGSRTPVKKWLCHLTIDPRFGNAVLAAQPKQYLAELTGGVEWEADYVDVTPIQEVPALAETVEAPLEVKPVTKPTTTKTGQQKIVARICAVAKEAGFTEDARDAMLAAGGYASKNDVPDAELVVGWFTPETAAEWNAQVEEL
jgi:Recombination directionality factor-like